MVLKKVIFFYFLWVGLPHVLYCQELTVNLQEADSLFKKKQWDQAYSIFKENLKINPIISLKMAKISNERGDFFLELKHLLQAYTRNPNENILRRMNYLASQENLVGYELNDANWLLMVYAQYAWVLHILLLLLGLYIFQTLFQKKIKADIIPFRHKIVAALYLVLLIFFFNLPNFYDSGIASNNTNYVRVAPNASATVLGRISQGNRLFVVGQIDTWYIVFWKNNVGYVLKDQIWLPKS